MVIGNKYDMYLKAQNNKASEEDTEIKEAVSTFIFPLSFDPLYLVIYHIKIFYNEVIKNTKGK